MNSSHCSSTSAATTRPTPTLALIHHHQRANVDDDIHRMRRAAARAIRTTCQATVRGLSRTAYPRRIALSHPQHPSLTLARSSSTRPNYALSEPLRSSMYIRRFSVALLSSIVGYGAWYTYKGTSLDQSFANPYSTSTTSQLTTGNGPAPTRNVIVVGADELHTGTFVGDGPISKNIDGSGRNVLEMLTPEQATDKLRENEASFMVNRGQGVLRYDVVQVASNNPIEDDHAEKIVEVASPEETNHDWMFWGVFDGHAYVFLWCLVLLSNHASPRPLRNVFLIPSLS